MLRRESQASSPVLTSISGSLGVLNRELGFALCGGTELRFLLEVFMECQGTCECSCEPEAISRGCTQCVSAPSCGDFILGVPLEKVHRHWDFSGVDGEIGVFRNVARTTRLPLEFPSEKRLLLRFDGRSGPFPGIAGVLTLMSRSGGKKGLRESCARNLGVPLH